MLRWYVILSHLKIINFQNHWLQFQLKSIDYVHMHVEYCIFTLCIFFGLTKK